MDSRRCGTADPRRWSEPPRGNAALIDLPDIVALSSLGVWAILFVRSLIGVRRTPIVEPKESTGSIVAFMPARNEANVIEESVRSVLLQPEVKRLVVIDDGSTDGTGEKVRAIADERLSVLAGEGPREGECGKPAALAHAYEREPIDAEWILFVDADVVLERGAVGGLLALANDRDLVSVIPQVSLHGLSEHAVMPSVGSVVLARNRARPFANGQVILVRRQIYEAAGGHRAVIAEVLEDVRLAEKIASIGGRLLLADGRKIARTRMYESWAELSEGWIKNLFLLLGSSKRETAKWVVLTLVLGLIGPIVAVWAGWPYGVAAYLAILAMQAALRAAGGAHWAGAILAPIGAIAASYLMLASMRRHASGAGVSWKGRVIRGGGA